MVDCSLCIHGGHDVQGCGSMDGQQIFCKRFQLFDNIILCGCLTFTATYIDFIARST